MTNEEWEELKSIAQKTKGLFLNERGGKLLRMTMNEEEHPEDYDGPCMCKLCCSYGD